MRKLSITVCFVLHFFISKSQSIAGIYELTGVHEVASGFELRQDSTFDFYFSYGALDRGGSGRWIVKNGRVVFNSRPWPGRDFKLLRSDNKTPGKTILQLETGNKMLASYVQFVVFTNGSSAIKEANSQGIAIFEQQAFDSVGIRFEFVPERLTVFKPVNKKDNHYVFAFETWLPEYFFHDFSLEITSEGLKGKHPLLDEKEYLFEKTP